MFSPPIKDSSPDEPLTVDQLLREILSVQQAALLVSECLLTEQKLTNMHLAIMTEANLVEGDS